MNDFKITVAGIVAATLSFASLYFFVYVQPLTGCENKKQFKIDALEIINLMEKGWESPRYLAPYRRAAARKYEILEVKYPNILESDNGGDYRTHLGYFFRLMLINSDMAIECMKYPNKIASAQRDYDGYIENKEELKKRIAEL